MLYAFVLVFTLSIEAGRLIRSIGLFPAAAPPKTVSLRDTIVTTVFLILIRHVALRSKATWSAAER